MDEELNAAADCAVDGVLAGLSCSLLLLLEGVLLRKKLQPEPDELPPIIPAELHNME